jgi:eukaryotic-like serine/threonine-protein kinase
VASTLTAVAHNRPVATATPNLNATVAARVVATQTAQWTTTTRDATATAVSRQPASAGTPQAGDTWVNPVDGAVYVYVPGGSSFIGSSNGQDDERPEHLVLLDGFWIMRAEVTNIQYAACIKANACPATTNLRIPESAYVNHPVGNVDWSMAEAYARWVDGRLPTEAEWEKTCRGEDQRYWPWGSGSPDVSLANYGNYVIDTRRVGNYPFGASPYGALDMAGNVMEWTADWYAADYYSNSFSQNPQGPEDGTQRVLRGGSFSSTAYGIRCTYRNHNLSTTRVNTIGFRVVVTKP